MRRLEGDIEIEGSLRVNGILIDGSGDVEDGYISEADFLAHVNNANIHFTVGSLSSVYSSISHNHNGTYAPLVHSHDISYAPLSHTHTKNQITDFGNYEDYLGNPSVDGYVLSSTVAGIRSWIKVESSVGSLNAIDIQVVNTDGFWDKVIDGYNVQKILESVQEEVDLVQGALGEAIDENGFVVGFVGELVDEGVTFTDAIELLDEGYVSLKGRIEEIESTIVDLAPKILLDGYEKYLDVPESNGYVLSSTVAGVRSWIPMESGGGVSPEDSVSWTADHTFEEGLIAYQSTTVNYLQVQDNLDIIGSNDDNGVLGLYSGKIRWGIPQWKQYILPPVPGQIGEVLGIENLDIDGYGSIQLNWIEIDSGDSGIVVLQQEVDNIEASVGPMIGEDGYFVSSYVEDGYYIDQATSVSKAIKDLDKGVKEEVLRLDEKIDNTQFTMGNLEQSSSNISIGSSAVTIFDPTGLPNSTWILSINGSSSVYGFTVLSVRASPLSLNEISPQYNGLMVYMSSNKLVAEYSGGGSISCNISLVRIG